MPNKAAAAEATTAIDSNGTSFIKPSANGDTASAATTCDQQAADHQQTSSAAASSLSSIVSTGIDADADADGTSDAETEPLPYDDDDDDEEGHQDAEVDDDAMDTSAFDQQVAFTGFSAASKGETPVGLANLADVSMASVPASESEAADRPPSQTGIVAASSTQDLNSSMSSPQKTGGYTGDELSAESDLTDEPDEDDDPNDANDNDDDEGEDDEGEDDEDDEDDDASSLSEDLGSDDDTQQPRPTSQQGDDHADADADADVEGDEEDDDEEAELRDEDSGERRSSNRLDRRGTSTRSSPRKSRGQHSDDDEEEDDDDADEEDDDDDESDSGHGRDRDRAVRPASGEDEAAEALAALTGDVAATSAATDKIAEEVVNSVEGLEGLAALASVGVEHRTATRGNGDQVLGDKKKPRVHQLRASGDDIGTPSSDITPEPEDDDGELSDLDDEDSAEQKQRLAMIASMKKRAAATGGAVSLLGPGPIDSLPGSAATSRAGSEVDEDEDDKATKAKDLEADDKDEGAGEGEAAANEAEAAGAETPAVEVAEQEEDTTTDEAAVRRQEAMEALTKIEIGFAMLRDRLYVERLEEISKEGEMIADGTHPELQHLTNAIELRRQRRMKLVEMCFEQQEAQYERVAKAEESAAWSVWRTSSASLRRDTMDDYSRKRRKLDREKRSLDAPRPARRHQVFETELVRNPDRLHAPMLSTANSEQGERTGPARKRKAAAMRRAVAEESEAANEYVAYPDLRGLGEADVWMDIERMGIRPAEAQAAMYDPFYGVPGGEIHPADFHAMFGPQAAAAAAQMGVPVGIGGSFGPAGYGVTRMPVAPDTPGSQHTPIRAGPHYAGAAIGHPMHGYDAYAAAELEHAHLQQQQQLQPQQHAIHRLPPHHEMIDAHGRALGSPYPPEMYGYPPHLTQAQMQEQYRHHHHHHQQMQQHYQQQQQQQQQHHQHGQGRQYSGMGMPASVAAASHGPKG